MTSEDLLFDDVVRVDDTVARYAEGDFPFLNRSSWPESARIRDELERWFARFPSSAVDAARERRDLGGRFRSRSDRDHQAAFFELFVHELLMRLTLGVEVHPAVPGLSKRPDFLVTPANGEPFYVEAVAVSGKSEAELAAEARLAVVNDELNKLRSPNFWLGVDVEGILTEQPPVGPIRSALEGWLATLEPDAVVSATRDRGLDDLPHLRFSVGACQLEFFAMPKSEHARGKVEGRPLGMHGQGVKWIDPRRAIRDAIAAKGQRFSALDRPYVVAVNALDSFAGRDDIMEALFGKEVVQVRQLPNGFSGEPEFTRELDGAFTSPQGPRYTRISAVLVAHGVRPWSLAAERTALCVYHSPFAERPLVPHIPRLARAVPEGDRMTWMEGERIASIFELAPEWPDAAC